MSLSSLHAPSWTVPGSYLKKTCRSKNPTQEPVEGGEERLSVFEDFLDKLDIDDVSNEEQ
jgi:hypothetical protein